MIIKTRNMLLIERDNNGTPIEDIVRQLYKKHDGKSVLVAKELGISRQALWGWLDILNLHEFKKSPRGNGHIKTGISNKSK